MNQELHKLQPYPFERLARLMDGVSPPTDKSPISLAMGEPKHQPPHFVAEEIISHLHGLGNYPYTKGSLALRASIADWLSARFTLSRDTLDAEQHILPVNGTREALFAIAQCVIDRTRNPLVMMPNPFYQIYEGAALLAGAEPRYLNTTRDNGWLPDFDNITDNDWARCQLLYLCSPGNPTGAVIDTATLQKLIGLAEKHDFIIASDECYSEIYFDEASPPTGLLAAAAQMGNNDFSRCIVFHSLSKRSNLPGMRSGFVAGDARIIKSFLRYRTYHGCSMAPYTQAASIKAWRDERHVQENRRLYRDKFKAVLDIIQPVLDVELPQAGFYLWPQTPVDDTVFARELLARNNIMVLPGSYLSRDASGINPGSGRIRIALVAPLDECVSAAEQIRHLTQTL